MTFYYVILEKRSYTREDTQLHTLISYVLLAVYIYILEQSLGELGWKGVSVEDMRGLSGRLGRCLGIVHGESCAGSKNDQN